LKVLIVGHGAREHSIAKKIAEEEIELVSAMGRLNPGIEVLSKKIKIMDLNRKESYDGFKDVDLAFIGPEAPLAAGIVDHLEKIGVPSVGPSMSAAKLEWSKSYARRILEENNIAGNPVHKVCETLKEVKAFLKTNKEVAVKPDGLTGGKGVKITGEHLNSLEEVLDYAKQNISNDGLVVLEEKLVGKEFTLQAFSDGKNVKVMPLVRDFKRAYDGDKGPNTGSMGSFSCPNHDMPDLPAEAVSKGEKIIKQTVKTLLELNQEYKGVIYGGFMKTEDRVYLIEYNVRFGDPEALNVLTLLKNPLTKLGLSIVDGKLLTPRFEKKATVCVYLVPKGYPTNPIMNSPIQIKQPQNSELYFASVYRENQMIKTTGSRALALIAKNASIASARELVYEDVKGIKGELFFRKDIALNYRCTQP
jgi:phosphoribosylamine--glycine ligase